MYDLSNKTSAVVSLTAANRTADANGTGVDLTGFESALVVAVVGAEGDTLSESVKIDFKLEHSDNNSDWDAVAQIDVVDGTIATGGIFATMDANAEAPAVHQLSYVGGKRYVRVVDDRTGTHTNGTPTAAVVVKGNPRHVYS
jgi:hypothetical protein